MLRGKVAYHFRELDSTNLEAVRLLRQVPPPVEWTSVSTDFQTAGRGQAGNSWHSSAGQNLLCSFVVYPQQWRVADLFKLTQVLSLAVTASILEISGSQAKIKWPNDVYIGERKVAGLLIQNSLQGKFVQWSVMGIGLNVNERNFPPELRKKATALIDHLPKTSVASPLSTGEGWGEAHQYAGDNNKQQSSPQALDPAGCFAINFATLKSKMEYYGSPHRFAELDEAYHNLLYRRGEKHPFRRVDDGSVFTATLLGVAPDGRLRLRKNDGDEELFTLKSVQFL